MEEGSLPIRVRFEPVIEMTSDLFEQFSALNDDMRIELTAEGMIELMPPAFGVTSSKNSIIAIQLGNWTLQDGNGVSFDSSGGFTLPNSAVRSPDASWVSNVRYNSLTVEEKNSFTPLCPDFVVELRSSSDRLTVLQAKMDEYIANGARLGWLLDPLQRQAHIYRPGAQPEILDNPETLSADPELPGFTLDLKPIWEPAF
jgi:Uma2 family endonuclease